MDSRPAEFDQEHRFKDVRLYRREVPRVGSNSAKRKVGICSTNKRISLDSRALQHLASSELQENCPHFGCRSKPHSAFLLYVAFFAGLNPRNRIMLLAVIWCRSTEPLKPGVRMCTEFGSYRTYREGMDLCIGN